MTTTLGSVRELLAQRPAWYVTGALMGAIVVVLMTLIGGRLGVVGGYSEALERATGRRRELGWRAWFLIGVVAGGLVFTLVAGRTTVADGYGWVTRELTGDGRVLAAAVLTLGGVLIGYGAKVAGGCTSGNGLAGGSIGSPGSLVATVSFMATAVAASLLIAVVV